MPGEVTHLLGGIALALVFLLLTRRRLGTMCAVARAQAIVVALAAAWQAWASESVLLAAFAVLVLLGGAVALPWAIGQHAPEAPSDAPATPIAIVAAALLVVLAILAVMPMHLPGLPRLREDVSLALAAVLVALLIPATRRAPLPQLVGLLALANGVALVAVVVGTSLATGLAALALFGIAGLGLAVLPGRAA